MLKLAFSVAKKFNKNIFFQKGEKGGKDKI
jgi:hypothetical protein